MAEIDCGTYRLTRKDSSEHKCIEIETKRKLTSGEIAMARTMFKDSIDYSQVYIHDEEYLPLGLQDNYTVMTPNGEIYFPKGLYRKDYSVESASLKHLFIHEMVHVWQYQLGYSVAIKGALLHPSCKVKGCDPYSYSLNAGSKLNDFNMEQQGDIIADYYSHLYFNSTELLSAIKTGSSGYSYRNYIHTYKEVLSEFLKDPKSVKNLPSE